MTAGGVNVEFRDANVFELAPGVKLIKDFDNNSRGYVTTRYVHTINDKYEVTANYEKLPFTELEPYVEYGVGFEKNWGDDGISTYGEVTRRDGGRQGWNGTVGLKWNFR